MLRRLIMAALLFHSTRGRPASNAMPLFWKPYKSDVTEFIEKLRKDDPTLVARQVAGRARLWDRPIDREAAAEFRQDRVPQQAYVYQPRNDD
jgi:hypothetical protein